MSLTDKALDRIVWQYRNGAKFRAWIAHFPDLAEEKISAAADQVVNLINIDNAEGDQLDICGRIAGIDQRPTILSDDVAFFGYAGTPGAVNYGVGPYKSPTEDPESIPAPDWLFRIIIKAKIFRNNTETTIDDVKTAVDFILGEDSTVIDGQDMTVQTVWVESDISPTIRMLIEDFDLIPRPQGVKIARVEKTVPAFGYAGTFNARNYGVAPYKEPN